MNKQALSLAIFIAGAYPAASSALGLGDIESNSHLNQPLRAKIDLLSAAPADASQIQVRLAPPDVFNRVGVARPDFLGSLRFTPTVQGGKPVILVSSDAPIQEPFVNFLLEVSWPQGQLLKEYTVMLDPPVLMQPGNTVAGEAAVRAEPKTAGTGNVRRPTRQAAPQSAEPAAPRQAAPRNNTYRVKSGDTLFRVASRLQRSGISNDQMMMALFRANPAAFIDENINNLRTGVLMTSPATNQINAVSRAEARRQIRQQNAEWREFRKSLAGKTVPQQSTGTKTAAANKPSAQDAPAPSNPQDKARLEVLGAKTGNSAASNAAVAAGNAKLAEIEKQLALASESLSARQNENNELKSRVTDLESMLSKKNRLLALRDTQLAELQQQLTSNGIQVAPLAETQDTQQTTPSTNSPTAVVTPEQGKDIQTHMANVVGQGDNTILRADPPAQVGQPVQPTAQAVTPAPPATLAPPATPKVIPPSVPLKPTIVPVTPAADAAKKPPSAVFADQSADNNDLLGLLTSPLALKIGAGSLALLLLLWLLGRRRKPDVANDSRREANLDDDLDSPKPHDEFDVNSLEKELEKADKHSHERYATSKADPFGLGHDDDLADEMPGIAGQAQLPNAAIEDDCLTEANVYIAYGLYQQAESELKKCIERQPDKAEYRHKLLECYFVANNREAFDNHAQQFAVMDGASKEKLWKSVVEWGRKISPDNVLYQGGGASVASTVATALGGMAAATAGVALAKQADVSLDKVAAPPAPVPVFEPTPEYPADDFGDLDLGELDFDDIDLDKLLQDSGDEEKPLPPVVPELTLPTLPEFDDTEAKSAPVVAEAVEDEPFDFDLDELDDLNDDLDLDFGLTEVEPSKPVQEASAVHHSQPAAHEVEPQTEHLLDFDLDDLDDLDDLLSDEPVPVVATAAAVPAIAAATSATNLNLHLDNQTGIGRILPKDTFYAPISEEDKDWLGDIDDALSFLDFPDEEIDLHEAHISTKLDLARAYLDMGDIEGARSTLEEVMVEGNDDQRREAEVLLHQTG